MRHAKQRNKLSRDSAHRRALMRNLCREVIQHERIKTSQAKAKAVKPKLEKLITLAKRGDLHARRQALSELSQDKFLVHKLFEEIAPRYAERPGGYTRIVKLGPRRSDSTEMVFLELVCSVALRASARGAASSGGAVPLDIAYDGSRFAGWAAQPGQRTVQGEIESALERITGERLELTVAGRTDAGVHATGQVASFEHERELPDQLAERLNAVLPARRRRARRRRRRRTASTLAARRRRASTATGCSPPPSATRSRSAGRCGGAIRSTASCSTPPRRLVVGKHDFTAFTPTQTEHVLFERNVDACDWTEDYAGLLALEIEAPVVHAQPGPGPGRDDARGRRRAADPRGLRVAARGRPARPRRRDRAPARSLPGRRPLLRRSECG